MAMKDIKYYYGFICNASQLYIIWKKLFPDDDSLFLDLKQLQETDITIRINGFLLVISSYITRKSDKPVYFVAFKLYEFTMNRLITHCDNTDSKKNFEKLFQPYLPSKYIELKNFATK